MKGQRAGEGQGVQCHYFLVILLGEKRLRNDEACGEAREKVKDAAKKMDDFITTTFFWHCFSVLGVSHILSQTCNQSGKRKCGSSGKKRHIFNVFTLRSIGLWCQNHMKE